MGFDPAGPSGAFSLLVDLGNHQYFLPWLGHYDELLLWKAVLQDAICSGFTAIFTHLDSYWVSAVVVLGVLDREKEHRHA